MVQRSHIVKQAMFLQKAVICPLGTGLKPKLFGILAQETTLAALLPARMPDDFDFRIVPT